MWAQTPTLRVKPDQYGVRREFSEYVVTVYLIYR